MFRIKKKKQKMEMRLSKADSKNISQVQTVNKQI